MDDEREAAEVENAAEAVEAEAAGSSRCPHRRFETARNPGKSLADKAAAGSAESVGRKQTNWTTPNWTTSLNSLAWPNPVLPCR